MATIKCRCADDDDHDDVMQLVTRQTDHVKPVTVHDDNGDDDEDGSIKTCESPKNLSTFRCGLMRRWFISSVMSPSPSFGTLTTACTFKCANPLVVVGCDDDGDGW